MAVLVFLFWVVLNGRMTAEIAVFGLAISAALYLFACRCLGWRPRYDWLALKSLPLAARYAGLLVKEIALSSLTMARYIFDHRDIPEPVLVTFRPPLRTHLAQAVLASSITLTPGTITVDMHDGQFQVHCYDRTMADGLDDGGFVQLLRRWEAAL